MRWHATQVRRCAAVLAPVLCAAMLTGGSAVAAPATSRADPHAHSVLPGRVVPRPVGARPYIAKPLGRVAGSVKIDRAVTVFSVEDEAGLTTLETALHS